MKANRSSVLPPRGGGAFTLIEILMVVSIIGLTFTLGVPAFVRAMHKEGMRKAQADFLEACQDARGEAILTAKPSNLIIKPREGTFEVPGSYPVTKFPDDIVVDFVGVNFRQYEGDATASVQFLPNGTSDDFVIIFHSIGGGPSVQVLIDPVTALADIEDIK